MSNVVPTRSNIIPQLLFLLGVLFGAVAGHYHGVATVYQSMFGHGVTPMAQIDLKDR